MVSAEEGEQNDNMTNEQIPGCGVTYAERWGRISMPTFCVDWNGTNMSVPEPG